MTRLFETGANQWQFAMHSRKAHPFLGLLAGRRPPNIDFRFLSNFQSGVTQNGRKSTKLIKDLEYAALGVNLLCTARKPIHFRPIEQRGSRQIMISDFWSIFDRGSVKKCQKIVKIKSQPCDQLLIFAMCVSRKNLWLLKYVKNFDKKSNLRSWTNFEIFDIFESFSVENSIKI